VGVGVPREGIDARKSFKIIKNYETFSTLFSIESSSYKSSFTEPILSTSGHNLGTTTTLQNPFVATPIEVFPSTSNNCNKA